MENADVSVRQYRITVAGRELVILGPADPHALHAAADRQRMALGEDYAPWWATPWPGAVMLVEFLAGHVEPPANPVLEIGAGLGLAGVGLAAFGFRVVVTDYDPEAIEYARRNAQHNQVNLADARTLDWREPPNETWTMIVGADCIYHPRDLKPIAGLIYKCLTNDGVAWLSDQNRAKLDLFRSELDEVGLAFDVHEASARPIPRPDSVDGRTFRGKILEIRHKR